MNSFQDHPQLHGRLSSNVHERLPNDLHGRLSFQDPEESNNFLSKTFHTIYRPKSVLSISNETDPDGKTKILMILKIKLPHWNVIDNMWVKVDDGAEANILPLDSFRTMFPHALDKNGYPKTGFLERSHMNLECCNDRRLINHGCIKLKLQHYLEKSFQNNIFYIVETKTWKEIIIGHPVSARLGFICVLCENVSKSISAIENSENTSSSNSFQDHWLNINGKPQQRKHKSKSESFQDHSLESFRTMAKNAQSETPFKTPHKNTGKSLLSRPPTKGGKNGPHLTPFKTPGSKSEQTTGSFKTTEYGSQKLTSFKTLEKRVKRLNPRYMVPVQEASWVISDHQTAKTAQPVKDQPSSGPPTKGLRFNPIYVEPGSTPITSTRDLQALFPNSFDCIGDMSGEYDIKKDPTVLPGHHRRQKVSIEYKEEIKKELGEMVCQGIITKQTEPTPWANSLTYPKKANSKLRICLDPKDLNKAIIHENHKAQGDSPCSLQEQQNSPKSMATKHSLGCTWQRQLHSSQHSTHTLTDRFLHVPFGLEMSQDISDENGWHCSPMPRSIGHTRWCVHI